MTQLVRDRQREILADKFQSRLARLNGEQVSAMQSAIDNGAVIVCHYLSTAEMLCLAAYPDGNRLALFRDKLTELEREIFGDLCTEVMKGISESVRHEVTDLLHAGALLELALEQGDVGGVLWLRAGDRAFRLAVLGFGAPVLH